MQTESFEVVAMDSSKVSKQTLISSAVNNVGVNYKPCNVMKPTQVHSPEWPFKTFKPFAFELLPH